jgi:hypothetical protein
VLVQERQPGVASACDRERLTAHADLYVHDGIIEFQHALDLFINVSAALAGPDSYYAVPLKTQVFLFCYFDGAGMQRLNIGMTKELYFLLKHVKSGIMSILKSTLKIC